MPRTRSAYPPEFRRQMVDLVRAGRSPEELAKPRREVKRLRLERDVLSRAAAWFAREAGTVPSETSNS